MASLRVQAVRTGTGTEAPSQLTPHAHAGHRGHSAASERCVLSCSARQEVLEVGDHSFPSFGIPAPTSVGRACEGSDLTEWLSVLLTINLISALSYLRLRPHLRRWSWGWNQVSLVSRGGGAEVL